MDRLGPSIFAARARPPSSMWFVSYRVMFVHAPIPPREIYLASISALLNLVLLKFQGMKTTPFDTHPKTMNAVTVFCLLLAYCIRLEAAGTRIIVQQASHFVRLFWSLVVASLLSLLLPDSISTLLYALFVTPFIVGLMHCVWPSILRKFRNFQRIQFLRYLSQLCINQRQIGMLPI